MGSFTCWKVLNILINHNILGFELLTWLLLIFYFVGHLSGTLFWFNDLLMLELLHRNCVKLKV